MKKRLPGLFFAMLLQGSVFGQYCMSGGPTSTIDSNVKSVQLTGASGAINFVGCPGVLGVQDLTGSQVTTLNAGNSYSITVEYGTCGNNYSGAGQVWIDYNGNFIFESNESIGTWTGTPPVAPVTSNFTVPVNALSGNTRMRVIQQEGTSVLPLDPCASFSWGSVMDFSIVIGGGIDCSGYQGDIMSDAIPITTLPYSTTGNTGYCYFNQNLVYNSPDIYYQLITPAGTNYYNISLCGSNFDTYLSVQDNNGNVLAYNDDGSCGNNSELTYVSQFIDTVYLVIEGWGNEQGNFTLNINHSALGMDDISTNNFKLYPNPVKDILHLENLYGGEVGIYDLTGQLLKSEKVPSNGEMSVAELAPGIYLFKCKVQNKEKQFKITKL